jgi:glycosyltransferase involved in cell wall biosynthesis
MRIAVDATCWSQLRGYGRHARCLLGALLRLDTANHYTFVVDSPEIRPPLPERVDLRLVDARRPTTVAAAASGRRSVGDLWRMSRAMSAAGADLLLFPTVYSYVPVWSGARKIVVIHDVIVETYPELSLPSRVARCLWSLKVGLARRQADAVVTVSETSRQGIIDRFKLPPDRVFVVGEASDPVFRVLEAPRLTSRLRSLGVTGSGRSVVYVGGFGPHKNLGALVDVFGRLAARSEFEDVQLVMVGNYQDDVFHSEFTTLRDQVAAGGLERRVVFTGYLPDDELVVLLNLATAMVLPSLLEGFGLPAVEAAACGCPVIATTASPLPALLGAGGLYVDPRKHEELEAALSRVLSSESLRRALRAAGLASAGRLTWEAAARQMLGVLQAVARNGSRRSVPARVGETRAVEEAER